MRRYILPGSKDAIFAVGALLVLGLLLRNAASVILFLTLMLIFGGAPLVAFLLSCLIAYPASGQLGLIGVFGAVALMVLALEPLRALFLEEMKRIKERMGIFLYRRKLYRLLGLVFPLVIFPVFGLFSYRYVLVTMASISLGSELLRNYSFRFNEAFCRFFSKVSKEEESHFVTGTTMYLTAGALASFFPEPIGPLSLIIVTLGDAWAVMVGSKWGRRTIRGKKTLEGTAACFFACIFASFAFGSLEVFGGLSTVGLGVGAVLSSGAELLTPGRYDNFIMTLAAAFGLWVGQLCS
jgi:dolichol kinase